MSGKNSPVGPDSSSAPSPSALSAADGQFDAFISYRRISSDIAFVDQLQRDLAARGLSAWIDREEIEPAANWADRIIRGLDASRSFVFVLTPESAASPECLGELRMAAEQHKLIVPVVLRPVADRAALPSELTTPQWILFTPDSDRQRGLDDLVRALTEDLDWRDAHARLTMRGTEWVQRARDRSYLLRGSDLRTAEEWLARAPGHPKTPPTAAQTEYVLASRKAATRTSRTWQVALSAGLAIALALTAVALVQRNTAQTNARIANSHALAAEAVAALSSDPEQSVSLAVEATGVNADAQSEQALRLALAQDRLRMIIRSGTGSDAAVWNPVRAQIAVSAPHGDVALWDAGTGRVTQLLHTGGTSPVLRLSYDASGSRLVAESRAGRISAWDISPAGTATVIAATAIDEAMKALAEPLGSFNSDSVHASWAGPRGALLYVYGYGLGNVVQFVPATDQSRPMYRAGPYDSVSNVVPSPDGSALLAGNQVISFTNATASALKRQLSLSPAPPTGMSAEPGCWFADGSAVVTVHAEDAGGPVRIYSTATGKETAELQPPAGFQTVACSPSRDDPWMAVGDSNGDVLLRLGNGTVIPLAGHSAGISQIAASPNGHYLATASADGTARIWDASDGHPISTLGGNGGAALTSVQFSSNGRLVLTADDQGYVRIWDAGLGEPAAVLQPPPTGTAVTLGFTSTDTQVDGVGLTISTGRQAQVTSADALAWDAKTGRLVHSVALTGIAPVPVPCSAGLKGVGIALWNVVPAGSCNLPPPARLTLSIPVQRQYPGAPPVPGMVELLAIAASPDGRYVAYARPNSVAVLDFTGRLAATLPVTGAATGLAFVAGQDELLVMTSAAIYLWHPLAGRSPLRISQPSAPIDAAVSASGTVLAAAGTAGTVGTWNGLTGTAIRTFRPADTVPLRVAVNATGSVVAVGDASSRVSLWDIASGKLIAARSVSSWPIIELSPAATGPGLLAADLPLAPSHGSTPGTGVVLDFGTGRVIASYESPPPPVPPINQGSGLSPDGSFIYGGSIGLAPSPPGGSPAVYQVSGGQQLIGLPAAQASDIASYSTLPADPWSADGSMILAANRVYRCDACQALPGLKATAASRIAWAAPLSVASDHPPATKPYEQ